MGNLTRVFNTSSCIVCITTLIIALVWPLDLFRLRNQQAEAFLLSTTKICFNSVASTFQSECVFCSKFLYSQTLQMCVGQPTLPINITQDQAFCIATTCIQQTWRNPIVLGRKKRSIQLNVPLLGSLNKTGLTNGSLILNNPLTSVQNLFGLNKLPQNAVTLAWNYSNRSLSWRIGRDPGTVAVTTAAASSAMAPKAVSMAPAPPPAAPAPAKPAAPPAPAPAPAAPPKPAAPPSPPATAAAPPAAKP